MRLNLLKHASRELPDGGQILVLNTGAVIGPESEAMLQALHSRSTGGIQEHLKTLEKKGAEKFMSSFYVGYGHKSIGDCGSITIFIEGVSMLAAKAIQDWRLYSGQESSTRYINFATQRFIDPLGTEESREILERWRNFYIKGQEPVRKHLEKKFPRQKNEDEKMYAKAISARAFDILRGFLPAGASTNLAWHSNLRQIADKLMLLRHHPLQEVQKIAEITGEILKETFPSSFSHKQYPETEEYNSFWVNKANYFLQENPRDFVLLHDNIDRALLAQNRNILSKRPAKTELPKYLAECGTMQFGFLLDFGSFRDIQRHRAVTQRMPLVTTRHGFEQWYINELPKMLQKEAVLLLKTQERRIENLGVDKETAQYYTAMGYRLPNRLTGDLPALVYLVELRATRFVHPTLQKRAVQIADTMEKQFGEYGLKLYLDHEPHRFDIRRGEHDIVEKK
jgi:thymidylate synthase ThyX